MKLSTGFLGKKGFANPLTKSLLSAIQQQATAWKAKRIALQPSEQASNIMIFCILYLDSFCERLGRPPVHVIPADIEGFQSVVVF